MDQLRVIFTRLGFTDVDTFIASGNVLFTSPDLDAGALERRVEAALKQALGYEVTTFIRTPEELESVATHKAFDREPQKGEGTIYVMFLAEPVSVAGRRQLAALSTPEDEFACRGREAYWCRRGNLLDSTVSGPLMAKALGGQTTMRNRNTIVRLVAKLAKESAGKPTPAGKRKKETS